MEQTFISRYNMKKETAQLALQFLNRTQIQGAEVAAFVEVINALNEIINIKE